MEEIFFQLFGFQNDLIVYFSVLDLNCGSYAPAPFAPPKFGSDRYSTLSQLNIQSPSCFQVDGPLDM